MGLVVKSDSFFLSLKSKRASSHEDALSKNSTMKKNEKKGRLFFVGDQFIVQANEFCQHDFFFLGCSFRQLTDFTDNFLS